MKTLSFSSASASVISYLRELNTTTGHVAAAPPSSVTKSRRFTASASRAADRKDSTPREQTAASNLLAERDDRDHAAKNFFQGGSPKTGHPISPPGPPHRQKSFLTKFPGMAPG